MPSGLPQPAFVLVHPQMGENVGAAARAMWNFGLDLMRVVGPRDGWPNSRAVALAAGAGRLLDEAMICATTAEALADVQFTYATTARPRDLAKLVLTPDVAMADAAERIARGERVAVLFGPERTGLGNDDIAAAGAIISVPVNPVFPSLNLGQCVLLVAHEWQRATGDVPGARMVLAGSELANTADIDALSAHYEETLDETGFFFPPHKAETMKLNLRNLWSRMALTGADVRMLHGVLRHMERQARRDP